MFFILTFFFCLLPRLVAGSHRPHGPTVRMVPPSAWSHRPHGPAVRMAKSCHPCSNSVAALISNYPSHNSHPLPSFFKKNRIFSKKIPQIFCRFKKRSYLCTRFRKKPESLDENRSLTDWNRTGKTRQRGVFRDAAMNTSSVRQSFRPDKGRYESETPSQDRQRQCLPARAAEDTFLQ